MKLSTIGFVLALFTAPFLMGCAKNMTPAERAATIVRHSETVLVLIEAVQTQPTTSERTRERLRVGATAIREAQAVYSATSGGDRVAAAQALFAAAMKMGVYLAELKRQKKQG